MPGTVATAGVVNLRVYDAQGRPVRELFTGTRDAGVFNATFDAAGLPAGGCYVELRTPDGVETSKLQVVR